MKNLLFFFATMFSFAVQAQTSLAEITGEENSLFNALAIYNNVEPEEFTITEFREAAEAYGESIGMDYVCHPKNGWNNVEMLWHRLPSPELRRAPRVTMNEPTIGTFTTEMDIETQITIQCIINSYAQGDSGILFTDNPLDTTTVKIISQPQKVRKMDIKPIKSEKDYQEALRELENLTSATTGNKEDSDKLEVLSVLVKDFENKNIGTVEDKKWEMIVTEKDGKVNMKRRNLGFNAFTLLGFLENVRNDVLNQINGLVEIDVIDRRVFLDDK